MRRETQNILLVLLGGALLKLALNGDYLRYVKPSHQPWLLGAAVVMLALGAVAITRDIVSPRRPAAPGHDHGEHHHDARSAWLLVLPVLAVFLVAPPALGADSVRRDVAAGSAPAAREPSSPYPPLPDVDELPVVPLSMTEFVARAGWDASNSLVGRTVSLRGFVVHTDGDTVLARMVIGCCAADASAVRVRLVGEEAESLSRNAENSWLTVTGTLVPGTATRDTGFRPDLTVHTAREMPEPEDPYEY